MAKRGDSKDRHGKATGSRAHKTATITSDASSLVVIFVSDSERDSQVFDLSHWRALGPVAEDLAEGLRLYGANKRATSRRAIWQNIESSFIPFCLEDLKGDGLVLADIKTSTINRFKSWLDKRVGAKGKLLQDETKRGYMSAVRSLLGKSLKKHFTKLGLKIEFPKNPWPMLSKKAKTEPLPLDVYEQCLKAIVEGTKEVLKMEPLVRAFHEGVKPDSEEGIELFDAMRKLMAKHDGQLPERKQLDVREKHLAASVGYTQMRRILYPQTNDLAPLFLFVIIFTGFNQQPLASLKLGDMVSASVFGTNRTLLAPLKHRSGHRVRRSLIETGEELSPLSVIEFIKIWTSFIRKDADARIADDLFLFCMKWKKAGEDWVRSLGETTNGRYEAVQRAVGNFLTRKLKQWVGTRQLRSNFADFISELVDGDLEAIGVLLGHRSMSSTAGPYRASKAKERDEIALAGAVAMRHRLVETEGQCDPRPLSHQSQRAAATPGWRCVDVLHSPIAGQTQGKACSAYGWCPACPLGNPDSDGPTALGRALQLKDVFSEAKDQMGAKRFATQYGEPEAALLEMHIPVLATEDNVRLARLLTLNPLPRIR